MHSTPQNPTCCRSAAHLNAPDTCLAAPEGRPPATHSQVCAGVASSATFPVSTRGGGSLVSSPGTATGAAWQTDGDGNTATGHAAQHSIVLHDTPIMQLIMQVACMLRGHTTSGQPWAACTEKQQTHALGAASQRLDWTPLTGKQTQSKNTHARIQQQR